MAKRFTDTEKWDDDWFLSLPPRLKAVWEYMRDTCDGVGVKKLSFKKLTDLVGEPITREEFDEYFSERVHWLSHDVIWIHGFIKAQYKKLSPNNTAHLNIARKALRLVEGHSLSLKAQTVVDCLDEFIRASSEGRPTPSRPPADPRPGDIGNRIKEKGKDLEEGGVGEETKAKPEEIEACAQAWLETLAHFKAPRRECTYQEKVAISHAIKEHGALMVRVALVGRRFEASSDAFRPGEHLSIHRTFKHELFDKFVNLAAKKKAEQESYEADAS